MQLAARFLERRLLPSVTAVGVALLIAVSGPLLLQYAGQWIQPRVAMAVAVAALILFCGHVLRAEKMVLLLRPLQPQCRVPVYRYLAIGFLFNSILPFRAGELIRAYLLGRDLGVSRTATLMTIAFERIVDAVFLGLVLVAIFALGHRSPALMYSAASLLLVAALAGAALAALVRESRIALRVVYRATAMLNDRLRDRVRYSLWSAIRFLQLVFRSRQPVAYLALSALMWWTYIEAVATLARALVGTSGPSSSVLAVLSYTSASTPTGPASFDSYLYTFGTLASQYLPGSLSRAQFAATSWFVLIVPTAAVGLACMFLGRRRQSIARSDAPAAIAKLMRQEQMSQEFGAFLADYFAGSSLVHALNAMEANGRCSNVKIFTGGSHAITALIDVGGELRVRKVSLLQHAAKLRAQSEWLLKYQQFGRFCRVIDSFTGAGVHVLDVQFRGDLQPFYQYIHHAPTQASKALLEDVLRSMRETVYAAPRSVCRPDALGRYIKVKVLQKVADTATMSSVIRGLLAHERLTVNGRSYCNLPLIVDRITSNARIVDDLARFEETDIHGDLTIDNILVTRGQHLILDPNDENDISDMVVDVAKLFQSLRSGYEFLRGLSAVEVSGSEIRFVEERSHQYQELSGFLDRKMASELPAHRYRALLFHEAVHYCRMLTYRAARAPGTVAAFYGVAVRLLNEFCEQYNTAAEAAT